EGEGAGALLGHIAAGWILLPSIALSEGGFRAWSPGTRPGLENLMRGLGAELDRTLGQIALLRGWRTQARAAAARRNAKSRLRDVVTLAADEPILTAARLRAALGVSRRAAFTLIDEAAGAGILTCVTPRTRWRVWVRPDMAARLAMRRGRTAGAGQGGVSTSDLTEGVPQDGPGADAADRAGEPAHRDAEALAAREAEALAALDTALARADALLARYAETGTRRKDRPE
ncbi:Fic family protein, partial [Jannaschia aquimarina]